MYIYNVTITIEKNAEVEWLQWMKTVHVPDIMGTGIFTENKICKLLVNEDLETTYAFQYIFNTMGDLNKYQKEFAPKLQQEHNEKFKDKFAAFRTVLEII